MRKKQPESPGALEAPFAFGVEEEFFLSEIDSCAVAATMPPGFLARCAERFGPLVSTELLQGQLELVTPVCTGPAEAHRVLTDLRQDVNQEAAEFGLALLAAGTHPCADWRAQNHSDTQRYKQMMVDFRLVAQRNLLCGLHVHVAVPSGVDRIRVMNRLMPWVPLLLALSTSSPFWNGQPTGFTSYRQAAYDEWPRSGIPDRFGSEEEYAAFVQRLVDVGALEDGRSIWWAVRPSPRYPTLEFRIADSCTEVSDSVCIAQICRCLVRAATRSVGAERAWDASTRLLIEENRWRAKRYGLDAVLLGVWETGQRPARSRIEELLALIIPDAQALGCVAEVMHARRIAERGTSADAQLHVWEVAMNAGADSSEAAQAVVRDLLARTACMRDPLPLAPSA